MHDLLKHDDEAMVAQGLDAAFAAKLGEAFHGTADWMRNKGV